MHVVKKKILFAYIKYQVTLIKLGQKLKFKGMCPLKV
jgi:hypothetical protein